MKLIISPAKKMNVDTDTMEIRGLPRFLDRTRLLCDWLKTMSYDQLKALWRCNDAIASLNYERLQHMELEERLTPAVLAYEGIQYRYMAPHLFSWEQFDYLDRHLRILSGFYGVLRPFDGVTPYRLEMQARLAGSGCQSLYQFWGPSLAQALAEEDGLLVDLASREYSRAVTDHLPQGMTVISCTFGELREGRVLEKGTQCKMARGEMVRYLTEHLSESPEAMQAFDRLGYSFSQERSTPTHYVFIKKARAKED